MRNSGSSEKLLETLPPGELFCHEEMWENDSDEKNEEEHEVKQVLEKASDHVLIGQITKVYKLILNFFFCPSLQHKPYAQTAAVCQKNFHYTTAK